jgi:hypothetical protein
LANLKRRYLLGDPGRDRRIIIKMYLKENGKDNVV